MTPKNPNYEETDEGLVRKEDAPDAKHKSRLSWNRPKFLQEIRDGVADLRAKQDQRNREHKEKHSNV